MEPLSAFAVACNVLQVLEVGAKLLSTAADYSKASDGLLAEHRNLSNVARSLNNLNTDLLAAMPKARGANVLSTAENRLIEANNQCLHISSDFIRLLDELKLRNKNLILGRFLASIKSLWHKDKVAAMEKAVKQARDNLNIAFLVYMNSNQNKLATQSSLETQTTRLEVNILNAVELSSSYIQDEVKSLSSRLDKLDLSSTSQAEVSDFLNSHGTFLQHMSTQLDSICAMNNLRQTHHEDNEVQNAEQRIMSSLRFPLMQHRKDHIRTPHERTFRWLIDESHLYREQKWTNFLSWIRATNDSDKIYWIQGKPGAGKSSLVVFLETFIGLDDHLQPWAEEDSYIQAAFYFWSSGDDILQKSIAGMLRSLLSSLLEQEPEIIPRATSFRRWRSARSQHHPLDPWTEHELCEMLQECVKAITENKKLLLLIDGLDEIKDTDHAQANLVRYICSLATIPNVKICVSSRPLAVFADAFGQFPQLRLQDLTYDDISSYVNAELNEQLSFRNFRLYDRETAESIISNVVLAADGVFLWVRLVVTELVRCLRDGNGLDSLEQALSNIPRDLDAYFHKIMESIEPEYRSEASMMLQLALWEDTNFTTIISCRLIDLSFAEEGPVDFSLLDHRAPDFSDTNMLKFRLESTFRRLQSRCKGLLECSYRSGRTAKWANEPNDTGDFDSPRSDTSSDTDAYPLTTKLRSHLLEDASSVLTTGSSDLKDQLFAFDFTVDFLHRSLRDFLLTPHSQDLLQRYSNGPFDVRRFLINARLQQARSATVAGLAPQLTAGLVSHIVCGLSTPEVRATEYSVALATRIEPVVERLMASKGYKSTFWYIDAVFSSWYEESSSFLTLAIDYGLEAYVWGHTTESEIKAKRGRPLLDHVLRPRFFGSTSMTIGRKLPDPKIAAAILYLGADPNERYQSSSVWSLYLCFLNDITSTSSYQRTAVSESETFVQVLELMIRAGAASSLPRSWLCYAGRYETWERISTIGFHSLDEQGRDRFFDRRWPNIDPIAGCEATGTSEAMYDVCELLNHFRPLFGEQIDRITELLRERGSREDTKDSRSHEGT